MLTSHARSGPLDGRTPLFVWLATTAAFTSLLVPEHVQRSTNWTLMAAAIGWCAFSAGVLLRLPSKSQWQTATLLLLLAALAGAMAALAFSGADLRYVIQQLAHIAAGLTCGSWARRTCPPRRQGQLLGFLVGYAIGTVLLLPGMIAGAVAGVALTSKLRIKAASSCSPLQRPDKPLSSEQT